MHINILKNMKKLTVGDCEFILGTTGQCVVT